MKAHIEATLLLGNNFRCLSYRRPNGPQSMPDILRGKHSYSLEICARVGFYAACNGNPLLSFRYNVLVKAIRKENRESNRQFSISETSQYTDCAIPAQGTCVEYYCVFQTVEAF